MKPKKPLFKLLLITDRKLCSPKQFKQIIEQACSSGIKAIQLREKDLTSFELLKLAKDLRKITSKYSSSLIINDRIDIAMLSKADGLHSPTNGITANEIKSVEPKILTGKSTHSIKDAREAEKNCFDFILFGPVFRTPHKIKYGKPKGLQELKRICEDVNIPVFAIGGITPIRAKRCLDAGASGVAVIRSIMKSNDVRETVSRFRQEMGEL